MGSIPSSGINVGERRLPPSPGGLQGLTATPSKLSSHVSLSRWCFACIYLLKSNHSMRLKDAHAAHRRQSEQQSLRSRVQTQISVHSSPLLGKLQQKRPERSSKDRRTPPASLFLRPPLPSPFPPPHWQSSLSFVGPLSPPVRLSADLLLKQYSTAG